MEIFIRIIVIGMLFIGLYFAADMFEAYQAKSIHAGAALIKQ